MIQKLIEKHLSGMVDALGLGVDEGIKPLVAVLREMGVETIASCEGHPDQEGALAYPWVDIAAASYNIVNDALIESGASDGLKLWKFSGESDGVSTVYHDKYFRLLPIEEGDVGYAWDCIDLLISYYIS